MLARQFYIQFTPLLLRLIARHNERGKSFNITFLNGLNEKLDPTTSRSGNLKFNQGENRGTSVPVASHFLLLLLRKIKCEEVGGEKLYLLKPTRYW